MLLTYLQLELRSLAYGFCILASNYVLLGNTVCQFLCPMKLLYYFAGKKRITCLVYQIQIQRHENEVSFCCLRSTQIFVLVWDEFLMCHLSCQHILMQDFPLCSISQVLYLVNSRKQYNVPSQQSQGLCKSSKRPLKLEITSKLSTTKDV